jgi:uncharacterized protein YndB with AHSA1/START domain/predicted enzyme related to lactoylglutathione lyase
MLSIQRITLSVDDQDKALAFYTATLGFKKKYVYELREGRVVTLVSPDDPGGPELLLEAYSPELKGADKNYQKALAEAGIPAASFLVADVKREFKRLQKLGVEFRQEPIRAGAPIIRAVLDDTCGNLIQLFEYWTHKGEFESATVSRHFDVSPERLFDAFVNPEIASQWLMTSKSSTAEHNLDPRPGGEYSIVRHSGDKIYTAVGEYLEVEPPRRLVYTFCMPQFAVDVGVITVEIEPDGAGSRLSLIQSGNRPGYEDSTKSGWGKMFDLLEEVLQEQ